MKNNKEEFEDFTEIEVEGVKLNKNVIDQLKLYQSQARKDEVMDVRALESAILFLVECSNHIPDEDDELLLAHLSDLSKVARNIRKLC